MHAKVNFLKFMLVFLASSTGLSSAQEQSRDFYLKCVAMAEWILKKEKFRMDDFVIKVSPSTMSMIKPYESGDKPNKWVFELEIDDDFYSGIRGDDDDYFGTHLILVNRKNGDYKYTSMGSKRMHRDDRYYYREWGRCELTDKPKEKKNKF